MSHDPGTGPVENLERYHDDGSVDSRQQGHISADVPPELLQQLYFEELRRCMLGLVWFADDGIRVLGRGPALLSFGPWRDGRRAITGGLFARRASGTIGFGSGDGVAWVEVERFAPLAVWLWRVEALLHVWVGKRYLRRVAQTARRA